MPAPQRTPCGRCQCPGHGQGAFISRMGQPVLLCPETLWSGEVTSRGPAPAIEEPGSHPAEVTWERPSTPEPPDDTHPASLVSKGPTEPRLPTQKCL
ncbi:unnamed protein product [Rangifer tarandus platyrhynchus]|uniref:Uncharacterized protein n=1 Tax=Rangifer tarandus platyrhynchus TaxID=3082113 RepID=A0ACB1MK47_RANTA